MRTRQWLLTLLFLARAGAVALVDARRHRSRDAGEGRTGRVRAVRTGAELAAAAARWTRRRQARRLDLGLGRRGVRRDARSHLDRAARRAAVAEGRQALDPVRAAHALTRQRHRQRRWPGRDVRADRETRLGAPLSPRHLRRRSRRQDGAVVAAARQAVRGAVRARTAQDQDEPVRSREARVGVRRSAPRHPQVHLRRQAGDDARHQGPARPRRRDACSIGRPTSRGCPTAPSSSATVTAARASPSSTRTASS